MDRVEQAQLFFLNGFLCSQSILMTYANHFDLEPDTAARIGAAFGGGVARRGETCGAVNGAFMVLGLKYGHSSADDLESKERTYQYVQKFISQFENRDGTIRCNELLGLEISSPEGLQSAYDSQLFVTLCPRFVGDAIEILDRLLGTKPENMEQ